MPWPSDHPLRTDPALRGRAGGVARLCPGLVPVGVLRHLPGRRVTALVRLRDGRPAVLKVFARPRARGNERRLRAMSAAAGDVVPAPLGCDPEGHVGLVGWRDGVPLDRIPDAALAEAARLAGTALRRLHASGAALDRTWDAGREVAHLAATATPRTAAPVRRAAAAAARLAAETPVCAHRDLHPGQIVLHAGRASMIDLDDAAMAPPGLDIGNLRAHLRRDAALGIRDPGRVAEALRALDTGYGPVAGDVAAWETLALLRLAALAETRFGRPDHAAAILAVIPAREAA